MRILTRIPLLLAISVASLSAAPVPSVEESEEAITISRGATPILTYHKAEVDPPEGVDEVFRRSGFIYPLHSPSGGIVTGIHPEDHYHHLGLWHAWVHTEYGGQKPDFWNLKTRTGRIRFAGIQEIRESGFTVSQEQVAYLDGPEGEPTVILAESLAVDVITTEDANIIDYQLTQTNRGKAPLVMPAYRYGGGIAYRAPHNWDKENSDYLTSEGLDRTNSHATRARWVAMFGPPETAAASSSKGTATVAILCHPENHDAPQRIRTWDKGPVFFNYVPVQETGWQIKPGETITLRYRLLITDDKPQADEIEQQWKAYGEE